MGHFVPFCFLLSGADRGGLLAECEPDDGKGRLGGRRPCMGPGPTGRMCAAAAIFIREFRPAGAVAGGHFHPHLPRVIAGQSDAPDSFLLFLKAHTTRPLPAGLLPPLSVDTSWKWHPSTAPAGGNSRLKIAAAAHILPVGPGPMARADVRRAVPLPIVRLTLSQQPTPVGSREQTRVICLQIWLQLRKSSDQWDILFHSASSLPRLPGPFFRRTNFYTFS